MKLGTTGFAGKIANARVISAKFLEMGICADANDAVAFHGDRFCARLTLANRANVAIDEDCVGWAPESPPRSRGG